jgi:hypothetical protein
MVKIIQVNELVYVHGLLTCRLMVQDVTIIGTRDVMGANILGDFVLEFAFLNFPMSNMVASEQSVG